MATYIENFTVTDNFLNQVKESIGYPLVDNDTLSEIFTDDFIKNTICGREAETFFNFFPLVVNVAIPTATSMEVSVDAPKNCLGVVHVGFADGSGGAEANLNSGNAFYTQSIVSISSSTMRNYGTPFDYNSYFYSSSQQNFFNNALKNSQKSYYAYYDELNNKIVAKSTLIGTVSVDCGCYFESVDMIPKRLRVKYLELCQSALGMRFASILKMQNSDLPLSIDVDAIYDENKDTHDNLIEWCQNNSTYCIMR